jgi:shikimate 5-dehydrogenase
MLPSELTPATEPTLYFIGVTTTQSSIMRVFPAWARHLGLGAVAIRGVDCKIHDDPQVYRQVVSFIKLDPLSLGGLVTTHKIDLLKAARDLFDWLDPYAQQLGEVSSISKRDGKLYGHAKDPISSGRAFDAIAPGEYWTRTGAEVCILGAGGSSLALTLYLEQLPEGRRPSKLYVTNRTAPRLEAMITVHAMMDLPIPIEYSLSPSTPRNDVAVEKLKDYSMVINATGLGKDAPGSPLTDCIRLPTNGIIWDFNYRGKLVFLNQARARQADCHLRIEDGWLYFIHGWLCVIAEVFHLDLPASGPAFDELCRIAAEARS